MADCAGRPSRTQDVSLDRRVCYQFTKEVTSLARPVHTLPAQHHSATFSPAKSVFVLEHWTQSAPSGFWPPRSYCRQHRKSTPWGLSQFLSVSPVPLDGQLSLSSRSLCQPPCCHMTTIQHLYKWCRPLVTTIPYMYRHYCPPVVPFRAPL